MKVLRVDPRNVYVKQHSILHINTKNCVRQTNGAWRYYLPKRKDVFLLELRVLQSRIPNTFPPVPPTTLKFKGSGADPATGTQHTHEFEIPLPAMGPAFGDLASTITNWNGDNGEYRRDGAVANDIESETDTGAFAVLSNWPVTLKYRSIDNRFMFHRKFPFDGATFLLQQAPIEITGSLLPYLGFSEAQVQNLASGLAVDDEDMVAENYPNLWGDQNDLFVAFPNLPHANHLVWGQDELENVYMILPIGAYGTEEITTYDADRSHMHAVAWTESNAPHTNYIDIKFQNEDGGVIDFNGRSWVLVMQVTYTTQ